jgi:hypothetical protein
MKKVLWGRRELHLGVTVALFVFVLFIFLLSCNGTTATAQNQQKKKGDTTLQWLQQWKAGQEVSADAVRQFGVARCFAADTLTDAVFSRIWRKSYREGCTIARADLRYLRVLHMDGEGKTRTGEMICNRMIASDLVDIFRKLYEAHYPIQRMVLIDEYNADDETSMRANNSSCFNFRKVEGSKKLSKHARGMAVDINTLYNPCVKRMADGTLFVQPATGKPYINRNKQFPYKISKGDLLWRLFTSHGFKWGGSWQSLKDYQHFEK